MFVDVLRIIRISYVSYNIIDASELRKNQVNKT